MITIHFRKDAMHITCNTADDSAQLDNWVAMDNPKIYIKEFYGMSNSEPCETEVHEGGVPLTQVGFLTRSLGSSIWNSNVLRTKAK